MTTLSAPPGNSSSPFSRLLLSTLSRATTYIVLGLGILILDLLTSKFLLFPILFVAPVSLAAWFCSGRLAYALSILLPLGRFCIAVFAEDLIPARFAVVNGLIRIAVLSFLAFLVSRTARQTRALERRVSDLVTICAWSRTVEYQGEWISFEQYLLRRFNLNTSHGISPEEAKKAFGEL